MFLPFELWLHIASYLPIDHLKTLYPVNRAFFLISMDERYKSFDLSGGNIPRTFARLKNSPHARRVRKLCLAPDIIGLHLHPQRARTQEWTVMTTILRIFRQYNTIWAVRFTELIVGSIGGMTNVEELTLSGVDYVWANLKLDEGVESLFRPAFSVATVTFGSTLRNLTLNLAPQAFYRALMPAPIFPKLEHLSVKLTFMQADGVSDVLRGFLVPLVNGHCSTVRNLTLTLVTHRCYDASIHMRSISHLPRLQKLDLDFDSISMDPNSSSGLRHMLETHSDELRELYITFPPCSIAHIIDPLLPNEWYRGDIGSVALPHLNILSLRRGCDVILDESAAYLERFSDSLTTLILEHTFFSSRRVEAIINILSRYERLEKLCIAVANLDPALFDLILIKLPNLTFLHLIFLQVRACDFQHPHSSGGNEIYTFYQEMRGRSYTNYRLRNLTAHSVSPGISPGDLSDCEAAIRTVLPDLRVLEVVYSTGTVHSYV